MEILDGEGGSLRYVAYATRMRGIWTHGDVGRLADLAAGLNVAGGLTGLLVSIDRVVFGVVEGPTDRVAEAIDHLRGQQACRNFTLLMDRAVTSRSHATWRFVDGDRESFSAPRTAARRDPVADGVENQPSASDVAPPNLAFSSRAMKVKPQQSRAHGTTERMLDAALRLGKRFGEAGVTLKDVSREANVSLTNVYRYFSSPDDIIKLVLRRELVTQLRILRADLLSRTYVSLEALADHLAAECAAKFLRGRIVPQRYLRHNVEKYFDIAYSELAELAGDIDATLHRCGFCAPDEDRRAEIAAALAATGAAGRMAFLHHRGFFDDGRLEAMAYRLLVAAMGGAASVTALPTNTESAVVAG